MIFQPTNVETPRQSQHSPNSPPLFCTIRIYITALLIILNIILCWLNIVIADLKAKCCNPPLFGAAYANLTEVQLQTCLDWWQEMVNDSRASTLFCLHLNLHSKRSRIGNVTSRLLTSTPSTTADDLRGSWGVVPHFLSIWSCAGICAFLAIQTGLKKRLCTTKAAYWISQGGLGQVNIRIMRSLPLTVTLSLKDSEPHSSAVTSIPSPALIPSVTAG